MERALSVPEIVVIIFRSGLRREDVVNVALVCRLWNDCASEVRWSDFKVPVREVFHVLAPLKRLRGETYRIRGEISRSQWTRFVEISNRITSLVINCKLINTTHEKLIQVEKTYGGTPFAKLRDLEILRQTTNWSTTSLFVVPSVKAMRIESHISDDTETASLVDTFMNPLNIQLVSLSVFLPYSDWLPLTGQFPNLQKLACRIQTISPSLWGNLGDRLNLTQLSVTEDRFSFSYIWDGINVVEFPALQELTLMAPTDTITGIILHSVMPSLKILRLDSHTPRRRLARQMIVEHLSISSPLLNASSIIFSHSSG